MNPEAYHSLALLNINLVSDYDLPKLALAHLHIKTQPTYEREALWVHWAGLYQELVPPAVQSVETLGVIDVIYQNAAVGTSVEGNT